MISSPIPVDPGYHENRGRGQSSMLDTRPVPRVRPEAEEIATRAQGSVGLLLQLQGQPVYRAPVVRKPEPKNFSQENVRRMRKIQAMSRKKKAEETVLKNQPVKVLPQSEKYKEIQSKVAAHIQQEPPAPRPSSANYLRSYTRPGSAPPRVRCPSPEPTKNSSQAVKGKNVKLEVKGYSQNPTRQHRSENTRDKSRGRESQKYATEARGRSSTRDLQKQRPQTADTRGRSTSQDPQKRRPQTADTRGRSTSQDPQQRRPGGAGQRWRSPSPGPRPRSNSSEVNFIAHNARLARKHQPQRPPSALAQTALEDKKKMDMDRYNKGEVPKYLRNRQQQWQEEENERIRNIPDPEMPPGHKMMPKEERIKTLNILKEKEKELQLQLHKVPLNPETFRAKTLKTEIETKLAEVEEAIKIFSRNKVFIKVDS